jgi:hypothetical protein
MQRLAPANPQGPVRLAEFESACLRVRRPFIGQKRDTIGGTDPAAIAIAIVNVIVNVIGLRGFMRQPRRPKARKAITIRPAHAHQAEPPRVLRSPHWLNHAATASVP